MKNYKEEDLEDLIEVVADLTDSNDHTNAYATIANFFGFKALAKLFGLIMDIQEIEGHTPSKVSEYRYELYQLLMTSIKREAGKEVYERIYSVT